MSRIVYPIKLIMTKEKKKEKNCKKNIIIINNIVNKT